MNRVLARCRAAFLVGGVLSIGIEPASADIDGQVFTAPADHVRLTIPKGWRSSDLPSYPGVLLYLLRSQPEGRIVVAAEPLRQQLFCSWPAECRALPESLEQKYACALITALNPQHNVGKPQPGPRENAAAGLPSVWFEYTDGTRYSRLALAVNDHLAVTMVLTTNSATDRASHARAFDQALRSLRELSAAEAASTPTASASTPAPADSAGAKPAASGATAEASGAARPAAVEAPRVGPRRLPLAMFDPRASCP